LTPIFGRGYAVRASATAVYVELEGNAQIATRTKGHSFTGCRKVVFVNQLSQPVDRAAAVRAGVTTIRFVTMQC
jgi:hypothetical protein